MQRKSMLRFNSVFTVKKALHTLSIHPGLTVQIEVAHLKTMQYKPKMMTVTWPESYLS